MQNIFLLFLFITSLKSQLFINEIDYDQPGTDANEFIEIAGQSGTYSNVEISLINGNNNSEYESFIINSLVINDEYSGYGFFVVGSSSVQNVDFSSGFPSSNAIQNGEPDGIELWLNGQLVDAVSYEGSMDDSNGNTMEVATPNGEEDQYWEGGEGLAIGRIGLDGSPWTISDSSPGNINSGQILDENADFPPIANAGIDMVVNIGDVVTLDGSNSTDSDGEIIDYLWEQIAGPDISLSSYSEPIVTFDVPEVTETTTWTFELTVEDDGGNTSSDDVNITVYQLNEISISDIQGGTESSPYTGQTIAATGIVTAVTYSGFFLQDQPGPWNGIWVYGGQESVTEGDEVLVTGEIAEYYDMTEIDVQSVDVLSSNNPLPEPVVIATGELGEAHEGVLVTFQNAVCTALPNQYGEWNVDDGTGNAMIDDKILPYTPALDIPYDITGPCEYTYSNFKVQAMSVDFASIPGMPLADAGEDQMVGFGEMVTLDGSGSYDEDGFLVGWLWTQISGPNIALGDYEEELVTFTAPNEYASLVFGLTVTDNEGIESYMDEVSITVGSLSITDIQYSEEMGSGEDDCYPSSYTGEIVTLSGLVSHTASDGKFFIQDSNDPWSGLYVYDFNINPARGDEILLTGEIDEYFGLTELKNVSSHEIITSENWVPPYHTYQMSEAMDQLSCNSEMEGLEGLLVEVNIATIDSLDQFGNLYTTDSDDNVVKFGDYFYNDPDIPWLDEGGSYSVEQLVGSLCNNWFRGVVSYSYGEYLIYPRDYDDISIGLSITESIQPYEISITNYPNPFNPSTTLHFNLIRSELTSLNIYDIKGNLIRNLISESFLSAGDYSFVWNAYNDIGQRVSSGVYVVILESGKLRTTRSIQLIK